MKTQRKMIEKEILKHIVPNRVEAKGERSTVSEA